MYYIEIPEKKETLYFPENLGECDARQYGDMAKLMYWLFMGEITYSDFKTMAVYSLLNMKHHKKNVSNEKINEEVYRLSELVGNFFTERKTEEGNIQLLPNQFYIHNHLPVIRFFGKFYGPEEAFENVLLGQYQDGLEEYINFSQTGDLQYLINLFAIFYLRKGEVYDAAKSKKRAKGFLKHIDIRHLYGFYLTFAAMQLWITSGEIYIGGNLVDMGIIYQDAGEGTAKSSIPGIGMKGVVYDIAESHVFGNYQQTRKELLWDILPRLYQLRKKTLDEQSKEKQNDTSTAK